MEHNKVDQLRAKFEQWEVDAVFIRSDLNRRWLTGFTGSLGYVIVTRDRAMLATDGRYWTQAADEAVGFEIYEYVREAGAMKAYLESAEIETLAIESNHTTLQQFVAMRKAEGITFKAVNNLCDELRYVKTAQEIEKIKAAAAITDYAMAQVNEIAQVGMTEKALAWELEKLMRERGADKLAFDTIVASGENGAKPHHSPSDRQLQAGDAITIDMGACLDGYHSDLTRTFYMGSQPDAAFLEIYTLVEDAHATSIAQIRPGMTSKEADALARDVIEQAGQGDNFKHSLGHGVGLEIHEGPSLSRHKSEVIPVGSVVTIEPGVYVEGWSGVRIEDLGIVTEDGFVAISKCPKNPIIPI